MSPARRGKGTRQVAHRSIEARVAAAVRDVPDFPKPGIVFKDITPVLLDAELFRDASETMAGWYHRERVTHVVAIESRGFILGGPVALRLGAAFVPLRKPGKLPHVIERVEYALEYGVDALECHRDALGRGNRALIVDDVLATGGTAAAARRIVGALGAEVVGFAFLLELAFLGGRHALSGSRVERIVAY